MKHLKVKKIKNKSTTLKIKSKVIAGLVGVMEEDRKVREVNEGKYSFSCLVRLKREKMRNFGGAGCVLLGPIRN